MLSKELIEHKEKSAEYGCKVEGAFAQACIKIGYKVEHSTKEENINDHIDFWITRTATKNTKRVSVDVKGGNTEDEVWLEFQNVKGERGWLYGKADYIAFDMPCLNGFIVVPRPQLLEYALANVICIYVGKDEATHKLYQRSGRQDVISRFTMADLMKITGFKTIKY